MYSYILTIEKVKSDEVKFVETGTILSKKPFPALNDAEPGQQYRLFTNEKSNNYGVGVEIKKVEKVQDD